MGLEGEADERGELVVDVDCSREWFNKHTTDPYPMLGEFCEYLRQAPLKKLRIEWRVYRSAYVQVLRTFPALEELAVDVMFDPTGVRDLFRALAEGGASSSSSSEGIVVPRLRCLHLDKFRAYEGIQEDFEDCERIREECGAVDFRITVDVEAIKVRYARDIQPARRYRFVPANPSMLVRLVPVLM